MTIIGGEIIPLLLTRHNYFYTPVQFVKGATSRKLQLEFEGIRKKYWGQHVWARGYFVATMCNVTDDMIQEYIRRQGDMKESDEFRIVN